MKKFMSFLFVLFTIFMIGSLSACSSNKKSANGFTFKYESNYAQKLTEEGETYAVIALEIKNDNEENNIIKAENFSLVQDSKNVGVEYFFGNNIIDKMTEESLDSGEKIKLVLKVKIETNSGGKFNLNYKETSLFEIRI